MGVKLDQPQEVVSDLLIEQVGRVATGGFVQYQLPRTLDILADVAVSGALAREYLDFLEGLVRSLAGAEAALDRHRDIKLLHRCTLTLYDEVLSTAAAKQRPPGVVTG
jgi:hypothetical protein